MTVGFFFPPGEWVNIRQKREKKKREKRIHSRRCRRRRCARTTLQSDCNRHDHFVTVPRPSGLNPKVLGKRLYETFVRTYKQWKNFLYFSSVSTVAKNESPCIRVNNGRGKCGTLCTLYRRVRSTDTGPNGATNGFRVWESVFVFFFSVVFAVVVPSTDSGTGTRNVSRHPGEYKLKN